MTLYINKITHYKGHRYLLVGTLVPNILEYIFFFRRKKAVAFVGMGTRWYNYPNETPVKKHIAKKLQKVYNQSKIY